MKIIVITALLSLAALGVETSAVSEDLHGQSATKAPGTGGGSPALTRTCSSRSVPICVGATVGMLCQVSPALWCEPIGGAPLTPDCHCLRAEP